MMVFEGLGSAFGEVFEIVQIIMQKLICVIVVIRFIVVLHVMPETSIAISIPLSILRIIEKYVISAELLVMLAHVFFLSFLSTNL
jgi:hypothetical protein